MDERRIAGNSTGSLALLLLVLVAGGAWNYHRNYQLEQSNKRVSTYSGYSKRDVELLRDAVAGELEQKRAALVRARRGRPGSARDQGSVASNVQQFNRTARTSDRILDAAADVAERERLKAELDQEIAARVEGANGMALHLARLTSF